MIPRIFQWSALIDRVNSLCLIQVKPSALDRIATSIGSATVSSCSAEAAAALKNANLLGVWAENCGVQSVAHHTFYIDADGQAYSRSYLVDSRTQFPLEKILQVQVQGQMLEISSQKIDKAEITDLKYKIESTGLQPIFRGVRGGAVGISNGINFAGRQIPVYKHCSNEAPPEVLKLALAAPTPLERRAQQTAKPDQSQQVPFDAMLQDVQIMGCANQFTAGWARATVKQQ